jgi:molybdopterin-guanine dinucleotide biosynthesis protein MobB
VSRRAEPRAIGVVGNSGTGKTTLLELLIPALAAEGLAVAAVKHASHGFDADRPGKDSHRLYASGAEAVALVSASQLATFVRRDPDERASLGEALASLPAGLDVVLVEGFAWEPIPRLVLVRAGGAPRREHLESGPALGVVEVPEPRAGSRPAFPDALIHSIAAEIAGRVPRRGARRKETETPAALASSRGA